MSETRTLVLGLIAGVTILLGLPIARVRRPMPGMRQFLNASATGILLFLVWDVLSHAWEPVDGALGRYHESHTGLSSAFGYGALLAAGLAVGLMSLVLYERFMAPRTRRTGRFGPGAMAADELVELTSSWSPGRRLAVMIAVGIGLHNFGEGLAIGGSAGRGEIALATLLVVGFALHNATEGFGIVAPLSAEGERPSWWFLLAMGLIGGGPTIVGTAIGRQFTSDALSVVFLSLAAGSILFVVIQLIGVGLKSPYRTLLYWGVLAGMLAGFATDAVVTAGGA
ncbi:MAG: ZIP family metal transporter [Frankia sp.]